MLRRSTRKRSASTMRGKQASTVPTNPSAVAPLSASTSQRQQDCRLTTPLLILLQTWESRSQAAVA